MCGFCVLCFVIPFFIVLMEVVLCQHLENYLSVSKKKVMQRFGEGVIYQGNQWVQGPEEGKSGAFKGN